MKSSGDELKKGLNMLLLNITISWPVNFEQQTDFSHLSKKYQSLGYI
jgi:hypothetical protein